MPAREASFLARSSAFRWCAFLLDDFKVYVSMRERKASFPVGFGYALDILMVKMALIFFPVKSLLQRAAKAEGRIAVRGLHREDVICLDWARRRAQIFPCINPVIRVSATEQGSLMTTPTANSEKTALEPSFLLAEGVG
jgi:hypothetical protein